MYILISGSGVFRQSDGAIIPSDPDNIDWVNYLAWLERGNIPITSAQPALSDLKALALADLDAKTALEIVSGFECASLGAMHHYPSAITDQLNLTAMFARASVDPEGLYPFTCRDSAGVWARKLHTAAQIQAVGRAGMDVNIAARRRKDAEVARIMAATNPEDLMQ